MKKDQAITRRKLIERSTALALGISLALPALAQEAPPPSEAISEIVVTSSRVARSGYNAPTPTTMLGAEAIEQTGATNIGGLMQEIPAFIGSATQQSTSSSSQLAGGNFVNLRGLGPSRTLVLVDGQRFTPTTNTGLVDTNVIPLALIERFDVVTGGASAAWGSDAVAGVTNFVLKKHLDGLQGDISAGETQYGDDRNLHGSLAYGTNFAQGRGNVMVAAEYEHDDGVTTSDSRDWQLHGYAVIANPNYTPTNGQPKILKISNFQLSGATPGGVVLAGPLRGTTFGPGGSVGTLQYGPIVSGITMSGGTGFNPGLLASMTTPLRRYNVYARASYDITDDITATLDYVHARSESNNPLTEPFDFGDLLIQKTNAFLPASIVGRMNAANISAFPLGRISPDWGFATADDTTTVDRGVFSLAGAFGDSWTWHAYAETGRTDYDARLLNNVISDNLYNAVDSVINPATGQAVCASTLTAPGNGCVPLNPFGQGSASNAALDYIHGTQTLDSVITQTSAGASLNGEPFSTWAGKVSVAAGLDYRREALITTVDPRSQADEFFIGDPHAASGAYWVREGFFETVVPLLHDMPFAKELDLNGAVRVTDYSTSGIVPSWKVGGTYAVLDDLTLRTTRSRDIRAPNLNELFQPSGLTFNTITNPVTNAQTTVQQILTGNPNLQPELADTITYGAVLTPRFVPGLSFSADVYNIIIKDSIVTLPSQTVVNGCYGGQSALCQFVGRDSAGNITSVTDAYVNLTRQTTRGIDFEASYSLPLSKLSSGLGGTLGLRGLASYVSNLYGPAGYNQAGEVGAPTGDSGVPHWIADMHVDYGNDPYMADLEVRYVGGGNFSNDNANYQIDDNSVGSQTIVNLNLQYRMPTDMLRSLTFYANFHNIFNAAPPIDPNDFFEPAASNAVLYDLLGRSFKVGMRFKY